MRPAGPGGVPGDATSIDLKARHAKTRSFLEGEGGGTVAHSNAQPVVAVPWLPRTIRKCFQSTSQRSLQALLLPTSPIVANSIKQQLLPTLSPSRLPNSQEIRCTIHEPLLDPTRSRIRLHQHKELQKYNPEIQQR